MNETKKPKDGSTTFERVPPFELAKACKEHHICQNCPYYGYCSGKWLPDPDDYDQYD